MANRKVEKILIKKSGVVGKVPTALDLGELAINFADVKLYASGTTANSIIPIGWDRISRTGDTVTGNFNFNGVISATTYQNLPLDIKVTGGTYSAGTATFTNNTGGTFSVSGFSTGGSAFTGGTVTGATNFTNGLTANTISATTYQNLPLDIYVTGGTYSSGSITFRNNSGNTFAVSGLPTGGSGGTPTYTGVTTLDFGFTGSLEGDFASTIITDTNVISSSSFVYRVISSTDHDSVEDSLLDGLKLQESDILDGVGFTLNGYALNNTWGTYNVFYKIIN